jgi:hypothetical protein
MDRFKFSQSAIQKAKQFLKGKTKTGPRWAERFKSDLSIKGNHIYFNERRIVSSHEVNDILRDAIFKKAADIPPSRDGAFHLVKQRYVGISRRNIMKFLAGQRVLAETKPIPPQATKKSGQKLKNFTFETDLIFVKRDDVEKSSPSFVKKNLPDLQYIVCTTEKLTGLTRLDYCSVKDAKLVTPIVKKHLASMCKQLKTKPKDVELLSDKGGEFSMKDLSPYVKKYSHIARGAHVENRNRQAQQNLYRILKARKARTLKSAIAQSQTLMNQTVNRIQKKTPNESAESAKKEVVSNYNTTRSKHIPSTNRELQIGDFVRILVRDVTKAKLDYKSYKGVNYSKQVHKIVGKSKKAVPPKYRIKVNDNKGKWFTIEKLLKAQPEDQKTEALISKRDADETNDERRHFAARAKAIAKEAERPIKRTRRDNAITSFAITRQTRKANADIMEDLSGKKQDKKSEVDIGEVSISDVDGMTRNRLHQVARQLGLAVMGIKPRLIKRIKRALKKRALKSRKQ